MPGTASWPEVALYPQSWPSYWKNSFCLKRNWSRASSPPSTTLAGTRITDGQRINQATLSAGETFPTSPMAGPAEPSTLTRPRSPRRKICQSWRNGFASNPASRWHYSNPGMKTVNALLKCSIANSRSRPQFGPITEKAQLSPLQTSCFASGQTPGAPANLVRR